VNESQYIEYKGAINTTGNVSNCYYYPQYPYIPYYVQPTYINVPVIPQYEIESLKKEIAELKDMLKKALETRKKNG
jgi:HAMP domain-containing protein